MTQVPRMVCRGHCSIPLATHVTADDAYKFVKSSVNGPLPRREDDILVT